MQFQKTPLADAFSAAYAAHPIHAAELQKLEAAAYTFVSEIDESKEEEYIKNQTATFLRNSLYPDAAYHINIDKRKDLVIRVGKSQKDPIAVILEFKSLKSTDMVTENNLNTKALQELVWYYMQERSDNHFIKHLVITNGLGWFVFSANDFETIFYKDKYFKKSFDDFKNGLLSGTSTDHFYKEIAQPFIQKSDKTLAYTYFNLHDLKQSDKHKHDIFKTLHPQHLLKQTFANDSNALNRPFYDELLHLLGLQEVKDGGIKRIQRKPESDRQEASLLENSIKALRTGGIYKNIKNLSEFGATDTEQIESIALELCITWLNRILFMKLLEGQLMRYHHKDTHTDYAFMSYERSGSSDGAIRFDFDQMNQLFFEVMAIPQHERDGDAAKRFGHLPYLNSALFEMTYLEKHTLRISNLKDNLNMPLYAATILKDARGQRETGAIPFLKYLLNFLNAYNFAAQGKEIVQTDNKTLINASVLGLVFEKLNGYRDGSFFTPGFVTMYMCRETIRAAVIQKYNETFDWQAKDINEVSDLLERRKIDDTRALAVLHSVRICDPAVGSGHFLVSALNELILIQKELFLLKDADRKILRGLDIKILNDELIVQHNNEPFEYLPNDSDAARIQAALFEAKRAFIENCLFGVDINPKSVAICQLRLWIELLKNAYYKDGRLQTLPNIDINIKTGNSLASRFAVNFEVSKIKNLNYRNTYLHKFNTYKLAVFAYKNTNDRDSKQALRTQMQDFKNYLKDMAKTENSNYTKILEQEQQVMTVSGGFGFDDPAKIERINAATQKLQEMKDAYETQQNQLYRNAFEWRFEFPEILDNEGNFVGFDAIVGNPPYIQLQSMDNTLVNFYKTQYPNTFSRMGDIYALFFERGMNVLKPNGLLHFIVSNKWMRAEYGRSLRQYFLNFQPIELIDLGSGVFENATVDTNTLLIQKKPCTQGFKALDIAKEKNINGFDTYKAQWLTLAQPTAEAWTISSNAQNALKTKIEKAGKPLKDWDIQINYGIKTGYNEAFIIDTKTKEYLCAQDPRSADIIKPILRGRDIKKYKAEWAGLWLIATYNGELVADKDIIFEEVNKSTYYYDGDNKIPVYRREPQGKHRSRVNRIVVKEDYPVIYKYLEQHQKALEKRLDKGEHWTNLRNCTYYQDFEKEKIVYPNMTLFLPFIYDDKGFYANQKCFILNSSSVNLKYLTGLLNSKIAASWIKENCPELQGGTRELSKIYFEKIPIPTATPEQQAPIIALVEEIIAIKEAEAIGTPAASDRTAAEVEREIDALVYALYGLTAEEIAVVEGQG